MGESPDKQRTLARPLRNSMTPTIAVPLAGIRWATALQPMVFGVKKRFETKGPRTSRESPIAQEIDHDPNETTLVRRPFPRCTRAQVPDEVDMEDVARRDCRGDRELDSPRQ